MASLRVQKASQLVDFAVDSPENQTFFRENLKYLGIEVSPGSHIDQVVKSLIVPYASREAQGIFKHRWMLFLMKPFVLIYLPLQFVGLVE
jgi:hypothetical protein